MSTSTDQYDHAIKLVDSTAPSSIEHEPTDESPTTVEPTRTTTGSSFRSGVARGGGNLQKEWAKRKYARYQEHRYSEDPEGSHNEGDSDASKQKGKKRDVLRQGRLRDTVPFRSKKPQAAKQGEEFAVDVLYENQRGSFFCGIPLYSSASLLNFDPSPWQTAALTDSPVDITNAQVPDPTWQWAWKRWYVDMSHDVDEEGWEYSFSFSSKFCWHGTHPWLYSFARRRRWLRKRVKICPSGTHSHGHLPNGQMTDAHRLNDDYFTIHASRREASREPSLDRTSNKNRSSWIGSIAEHKSTNTDDEDDLEVLNVSALLKQLKHTTIDRKKLLRFKNFLSTAGDELVYLPDAMQEIMSLFMYQSSRRQAIADLEFAVSTLHSSLDSKSAARSPSPAVDKSRQSSASRSPDPSVASTRQLRALRTALESVSNTTNELEYWSDVKELASPIEGLDFTTEETLVVPAVKIGRRVKGDADDEEVQNTVGKTRVRTGIGARIKGIPKEAGLDEEVGLHARLQQQTREEKGKEKEQVF
jgi:hypothetical protein